MKDIAPILRSLGLADSEVRTYMAALEGGAQTVLELAKKTKLSRQATYVAIDALTERGLMTTRQEEKRNYYMAEHPDKLLAYAKRRESEMHEKISDLERSIPSLELQIGGERPVVKMYEGKEGIRAIIEDTRQMKPKELYELTDGHAMLNTITYEDLQPYRDVLRGQRSSVSGLYAGESRGEGQLPGKRRFLPKEDWNFKSHIQVVKNKVTMVTFTGKLYSIVIDSKPIADAMRILFKYAHRSVKE